MSKKKSTTKTFVNSPLLSPPDTQSQMQIDFQEVNDSNQCIVDESKLHTVPSIEDKDNVESHPSAKENIQQNDRPQTIVTSNIVEKSLWNEFINLAEESQKLKKKDEVQVWIDVDLKNIVDRIRISGIRLPIKHLMNGMLRAFITVHRKEIEKLLRKNVKF